jgi:hypothetical protein
VAYRIVITDNAAQDFNDFDAGDGPRFVLHCLSI